MFIFVTAMFVVIQKLRSECSTGCLKCDTLNLICLYCDTSLNYTLYQNSCAITEFPNCNLYTIDGMCTVCESNYYVDANTNACVAVSSASIISNCAIYSSSSVCSGCSSGYYLTDAGCQLVAQKTEGCVAYVTNNALLCALCSSDYYASLDQTTCIKKPSNSNCASYSNVDCLACNENYLLNHNYYIDYLFDLTDWQKNENFKEWSNYRVALSIPQCEPTSIRNCNTFIDYKTCVKCKDGYIISPNFDCQLFPVPRIVNCTVYKSVNECLSCAQGFYPLNATYCAKVEVIKNCETYNTSATVSSCTNCLSNYYLVSSTVCQLRTFVLSSCSVFNPIADNCLSCNNTLNLQVTSDGFACLAAIEKCQVYDSSTMSSAFLTCATCAANYTFNTMSKVCQLGTVSNCVTYGKNNACLVCATSYFLFGSVCSLQPPLTNCKEYSASMNNTCSVCKANSYMFTMSNYCFLYTVIPYCALYYDQNICSKCQDGYYLKDTSTCAMIPTSYNCIRYSGGQCVKCLPTYFLNFGICELPSDYQLKNCLLNNIDGTISRDQFQCLSCISGAIPLNMKGFYVCTNPNSSSWLIPNCLKYSLNNQGRQVCDICAAGFYIYSGTCVSSCPVGTVLFLAQYQGFNSFGQNANNNFTITGVNVCDVSPLTDPHCTIVSPGAVQDQVLASGSLSNQYVCQKCADNTISVIGDSSGVAFTGIGASGIPPNQTTTNSMNSPLDLFPAFTCVLASAVNIYSDYSIITHQPLANCLYYHNPSPNVYCCIRCIHGYSAKVFTNSANTATGCLSTCVVITNCDASKVYKGLWRSISAITFARSLLSTYFPCHKCSGTNVPLTLINFTVGTGFTQAPTNGVAAGLQKYYPFPCLFAYSVMPNWAYQKSLFAATCTCWCNSCSWLTYSFLSPSNYYVCNSATVTYFDWRAVVTFWGTCFISDNYLLFTYPNTFYGTAMDPLNGYANLSSDLMTQCVALSPYLFRTSVGFALPLAANCAMYLANAMWYPVVLNQSAVNLDLLNNLSIYCAACMPGYRPVDNYVPNNLPFLIYNCVQIDNCSADSTWANFCSQCMPGFVYKYINNIVDYSYCLPFSLDPNCLAISVQNSQTCAVCNKGYFLNPDNVCDQIQIPFCTDNLTFNQKYVVFDGSYGLYLGPTLFYLYPSMPSCNICQSNYVGVRTTSDTIICVTTNYIRSNSFIANSIFKTTKCKNFNLDSSGNYNCYTCINGYLVSSNGNCYAELMPNHQNCQLALNEVYCDVCLPNYVFVNLICVAQSIPMCMTYMISKSLKQQVCTKCSAGYYANASGSICYQGTVSNCVMYSSMTQCDSCATGFQLSSLANGVSYCMQIPASLKCLTYDHNFQSGIMRCSSCLNGYVNSNNGLFPTNYCLEFGKVANCIKYDTQSTLLLSSFNCTQCSLNYYLSSTTYNCVKRTSIDLNCVYLVINADKCTLCSPGYYIDTDFIHCLPNPTGIAGCLIYKDSVTCLNCTTNYYLHNGTCVSVNNSTLPNCLLYSAPSVCSLCESNYYLLSNNTCNASIALNCLTNADYTSCATCPLNSGFKKENNAVNCVAFTDLSCLNSTVNYPFSCNLCQTNYAPDVSGVCQPVALKIDNCVSYQASGVCSACSPNSALSIDGKSCLTDARTKSFIDANCSKSIVLSEAVCVACQLGFYFDVNRKCQACLNNCAICGSNGKSCVMCLSGFYMNVDGNCIPNGK